ncbi:helix-hairpin-helix domain-containing protein [Carnobacterium mobile]|uniref:helix-hairpin-helix domain-containing protein n=1 Tax=Carnobacterium mobile TaxID=2750 RepID=UPI000555CD39|nr:helix-hairpin-helix domain-containing protein [Carnobacterium mobile]
MEKTVKQWIIKNRLFLGMGTGLLLLIMIGTLIFMLFSNPKPTTENDFLLNDFSSSSLDKETKMNNNEADSPDKAKTEKIYVDVKGAVYLPGVYEVSSDLRLIDAIALAGGFLPTANQESVNLAQKLSDQMMITIPEMRSEAEISSEIAEQPPVTVTVSEESKDTEPGKVNINAADTTELQTLSGIGEKKAEQILQYRQENGSFQTIEELKEVSGIGEKTFEALKAFITVGVE